MKVIIAGTRTFYDYGRLKMECDRILKGHKDIEIVSGCAPGADTLGERYAEEKGYSIKQFPADWRMYQRSAGPLRNQQMADYGEVLIAFWDGKSKGTEDMISRAHRNSLEIITVMI